MRLGGEVLTDVTIRPEVEDGFPDPKPNDTLHLPTGEELTVWAAPRISHPKGSLLFNVQFQAAEIEGVTLDEVKAHHVEPVRSETMLDWVATILQIVSVASA